MRKFFVLLLLLLLLPAVSARVRLTRTELVDGEFFVGVGCDKEGLKDAAVSISFPELGYRFSSPEFDIAKGDTKMKRIMVDGLPSGEYYARVTVSNDYSHRTKYVVISII